MKRIYHPAHYALSKEMLAFRKLFGTQGYGLYWIILEYYAGKEGASLVSDLTKFARQFHQRPTPIINYIFEKKLFPSPTKRLRQKKKPKPQPLILTPPPEGPILQKKPRVLRAPFLVRVANFDEWWDEELPPYLTKHNITLTQTHKQALFDWVNHCEHGRPKGGPCTKLALEKMIKHFALKLDKLAPSIDEAIRNQWQGVHDTSMRPQKKGGWKDQSIKLSEDVLNQAFERYKKEDGYE